MKNKNIWLVLSWWWINWFVYVGVIKYLEEKWIKPIIVWWTSIGSVFWAMISAWYKYKEIKNYVLDLEKRIKNIKYINWKNISKSTITAKISDAIAYWYNEIKKQLEK
jgi:predicted acylesterase/phospholipase RssA